MIIRLDLQAWAHDLKSTVHAHRGEATIRAQHGLRDLANESRVKSQAARDVLDHLHSYRGTLIDPRPVQSWLDAKVVGAEGVERSMFELFRRDLNGYLIAVEEPRSFRVAYRIGRKVGRFVRSILKGAAALAALAAFFLMPWYTPQSWWEHGRYEQRVCVKTVTHSGTGVSVYTTDGVTRGVLNGVLVEEGKCYQATLLDYSGRGVADPIAVAVEGQR